MNPKRIKYIAVIFTMIFLLPVAAVSEDSRIIFKHDKTGVADEINQIKEFDYELRQRERERIERQNLEDSVEAQNVGDVYYEKGQIEEAIFYYQIAMKMDPSNTEAHKKYIAAREREKAETSHHYHRAMEYYRQGMTEKAVDELIMEIKKNPDNEKARVKLNEIEQ